ncbi:MAG TPA: GNAT family protein [Aggregatilinea sp.]|uniref:GNAT family N-acetyltransferase n=1 Tax=Aggregatilinea sp. TaxID=2806333 RepID=UPI002BCEC502|nr:GNAT family protein [Aggregatilinea sp.]HML24539.1 GNAT family protein [Aggregatilinea sp.]
MLEGILVDLVPFGQDFGKLMGDWMNGPAAYWANVGDRPIASRAMIEHWLEGRNAAQHGPARIEFGVRTKSGKPIGQMGVNFTSDAHRWANLGVVIGNPTYWGGGYGTDGFILLVDYLFTWLDLRRIYVETMASNVRVQRMMDKLEFTFEGRRRAMWYADGSWQDALVYGVLCNEWPGRATLVEKLGLRARPEPEA